MRIMLLTQDDNLYLPASLARVCGHYRDDIAAVIVSPAMSTHGGAVKGFFRHLGLFGLRGTAELARRVLWSKFVNMAVPSSKQNPPRSIHAVADSLDIPYHYVPRLSGDTIQSLIDRYMPELLVSMSCPQVIGRKIRDRFPKGCINVHGSPLPKYRGLMPAFWVLRNGETRTAVTVHDLAAKLDDGDILLQRQVEISPEDTWDSLVRKTKAAGAQALIDTIRMIDEGVETRTPNKEADATYFSFPSKEDRNAFISLGRRFF